MPWKYWYNSFSNDYRVRNPKGLDHTIQGNSVYFPVLIMELAEPQFFLLVKSWQQIGRKITHTTGINLKKVKSTFFKFTRMQSVLIFFTFPLVGFVESLLCFFHSFRPLLWCFRSIIWQVAWSEGKRPKLAWFGLFNLLNHSLSILVRRYDWRDHDPS